ATRRWSLWAFAASLAGCALAFAWNRLGLRATDLALVSYGAGACLWFSLLRVRDYRADERGLSIAFLSWTAQIVGLGLSLALVGRLQTADHSTAAIVAAREWAVIAIAVASGSVLLMAEGLRLRARAVWVAGSAGLLVSTLLAIAAAHPHNVQAYTLPVGIYLA